MNVDMSLFARAMRQVAETMSRIDFTKIRRLVDHAHGYDEHHPKPLCIDGHEYARRRRKR